MRTLITGIAGSGKSTIVSELRRRGYRAIDLDDCGVCVWVNKQTGEQAEYVEGAGKGWIEQHRWQVVIPRLIELLDSFPEEDIFVGGKVASVQVEDIGKVFDVLYLLRPSDPVVRERLGSRTSNKVNFAKTKEEREAITENRAKFEQICYEAGMIVLDNHGSVEEIVDRILVF